MLLLNVINFFLSFLISQLFYSVGFKDIVKLKMDRQDGDKKDKRGQKGQEGREGREGWERDLKDRVGWDRRDRTKYSGAQQV